MQTNSLNQFFKEMYGDQSGEFVFGYFLGVRDNAGKNWFYTVLVDSKEVITLIQEQLKLPTLNPLWKFVSFNF